MTASAVAASVALLASLGFVVDALEVICAQHKIDRAFALKVVRPQVPSKFVATAISFLSRPEHISLSMSVRALAAFASVYALAYDMNVAIVTIVVVILGVYLPEHRMPRSGSGANMMQRFIWMSLLLFAIAEGTVAKTAALGFIAFQGLFSYFMAGVSKLKIPAWRNGTAVGQIATTEVYGLPALAMSLPLVWISAFFTWSTLAFEVGAPFLVLLGPEATLAFCGIAFLFHVGVALVLGLTPFIFAFSAAYPAIYWTVVHAPSLV